MFCETFIQKEEFTQRIFSFLVWEDINHITKVWSTHSWLLLFSFSLFLSPCRTSKLLWCVKCKCQTSFLSLCVWVGSCQGQHVSHWVSTGCRRTHSQCQTHKWSHRMYMHSRTSVRSHVHTQTHSCKAWKVDTRNLWPTDVKEVVSTWTTDAKRRLPLVFIGAFFQKLKD